MSLVAPIIGANHEEKMNTRIDTHHRFAMDSGESAVRFG